jgi:tetratricopeptide (TPR) repeat protein
LTGTALAGAAAALAAGEAERALALLAPVLAGPRVPPDALQLQAGALLQLGRAPAAARALRQALAARPRDPRLACNLGVAEHAAGRFDAARAAFEAALALRPDSAEALAGLAAAARAAGDPAAAAATWRRLLALRPQDPAAGPGLALALADAGQDEQALAQATALVRSRPTQVEAWRILALVHERAGRIDDALAALAQGVRSGADAQAMAMAAGHLAHRAGRLLAAAAAFARATEIDPQAAEAWNNLAACQTLLNRIDEAIASARRALALAPGATAPKLTLAAALSRSRETAQVAEALAVCRLVLATQPDCAGAHDCAALVLAKLGDPAAAQVHARAALAAEPDNPGYAVTLARVLEQAGDLAAAEGVLAARDSPAAPAPLQRQLGHVRLRLGQAGPALAALDRAWRQDPSDQGGIAERALALAQVDGWPAADAWLDQAGQVRPVEIATPPGFADRAAFLAALAADIRGHSQLRFEPAGLVARGGYLTGDLLADATPAITGFAASLRAAIAGFIAGLPDRPGHPFLGQVPRGEHLMHVWATRVREQGLIDTHYHEGSWLSGAFYVELPPGLGATDQAGWLEFGQPFPGLPAPPPERLLRIRPAPGLMLFFPSYLFHRTLPYRGEGERISISFDLGPR